MKFIRKTLTKDFNSKCQELELQAVQTQFKKSKKKSFHLDSISSYRSFNDSNISAGLFLDNDFIAEEFSFLFFLKYLAPNLFSSMINVLISSSEIHFIGKTKDLMLYDGVAFGSMYMLCFFYYIGCGFSENITLTNLKNCLDKDIKKLIKNTICARILCTVYFIFILVFTFLYLDDLIYIFFGELPYKWITKQYIWLTSPAYLMTLHYNIYCKYAGIQLLYKPILIGMLLSVVLYPTLSMLLIYKLDCNIYGVCLSMILIEIVKLGVMIVYFYKWDPLNKVTFKPKWNKITKNVVELFKKSMKNTYFNFSENIGFLFSSSTAALKGEVFYAKQIMFSKISNINFFLYNSFLNTDSIIVKNFLKLNLFQHFKKTLIYSSLTAFFLEMLIITLICKNPSSFMKFFSENELVYSGEYVHSLPIYIFIYMFLDLFQSKLYGVLLGLNSLKQPIVYSGLIFLIMQPVLTYISLGILDQGLDFIWIWNIIGLVIVNMVYIYRLWIINYNILFEDTSKKEEGLYFNELKGRRFLSCKEISRMKPNKM